MCKDFADSEILLMFSCRFSHLISREVDASVCPSRAVSQTAGPSLFGTRTSLYPGLGYVVYLQLIPTIRPFARRVLARDWTDSRESVRKS